MKLLICTQKVDSEDPILGFFHEWIKEFAEHCEKLTIICLEKGESDLPENVQVLSLGKEEGINRFKYILRFYKYIWKYRQNYDAIFVHMNPKYICLGGIFWRIWRKKVSLWYMHRKVDLKLKFAEKLTNIVFSGTKESFKLKTKKLKVTGHGINLDKFLYEYKKLNKEKLCFINTGRLSSIKRVEDLIEFAKKVKDENIDFNFEIIGAFTDNKYEIKIKSLVQKYDLKENINFVGVVSNQKINKYLREADIFIHCGETSSLDKAFLEAMASGTFVFSNVESSRNILKENNLELLTYNNLEELVDNLNELLNLREEEQKAISLKLREIVEKDHNLKKLIKKIIDNL